MSTSSNILKHFQAMPVSTSAAVGVSVYLAAGILHEILHLGSAAVLGLSSFTVSNLCEAVLRRRVAVPGVQTVCQEAIIRHTGWIGSLIIAVLVTVVSDALGAPKSAAAWIVALEAVCSDLISPKGDGWFHCGCFGIILLSLEHKDSVMQILEQMVRVTQMRGAQSGGLVTFKDGLFGYHGIRTRVANGKRDCLATKLLKRFKWDLWRNEHSAQLKQCPKVYAGHTRFATSSKATVSGTHPHRWSPAEKHPVWSIRPGEGVAMHFQAVETYVCHNGDLDFFEIHGQVHPLGDVRQLVEDATKKPCPAPVDSVVVAGLIELLRTKGIWQLSLRYALLFRTPHRDVYSPVPSERALAFASHTFLEIFEAMIKRNSHDEIGSPAFRMALSDTAVKMLQESSALLGLELNDIAEDDPESPLGMEQLQALATATVNAFFDNDLLYSVQEFLRCARGSFGLSVTCSLDIGSEMVLAAKGQTISVAFYPRTKLVLWGSEAAACKAAMYKGKDVQTLVASAWSRATEDKDAVRIDLNDLEGEVCLLSWPDPKAPHLFTNSKGPLTASSGTTLLDGALRVKLCSPHQGRDSSNSMKDRFLRLEGNPLILPLPIPTHDPVGNDIADIPRILSELQRDWVSPGSLNRLSACTLCRSVLHRLDDLRNNTKRSPQTIDILITGCEVSLWVAEQFAADLHKVFPLLSIRAISANKVLGMLGHNYPVPQFGFSVQEESFDLYDSIVVIVSHSGGTFAPLAISKLLRAVTKHVFVVTSEWDTQISRELRSLESWSVRSRIFSTGVGLRAAEPCTVSVAATHQLLTQILLQLMLTVQAHQDALVASGGSFINDDLLQLQRLNQDNIRALETITGSRRTGAHMQSQMTTKELRSLGQRWSQHVLEIPISWMLSAAYILITVTFGVPVLTSIVRAAVGGHTLQEGSWRYAVFALDAFIYLFCPQLFIWLIRLVNRRPLMHRMGHRSVVIGDIPWVAQCAEAYLSKLFASGYSNASVSVYSANPADHLVHRMTHRVARGTLIAVGRPDGRLSAMTSAENAVLLSVNQASSIQNLDHACSESITIGNNPFRLPLSKAAVFLPFQRPKYLCETALVHGSEQSEGSLGKESTGRGLEVTLQPKHKSKQPSRMSCVSGKATPAGPSGTDTPNLPAMHGASVALATSALDAPPQATDSNYLPSSASLTAKSPGESIRGILSAKLAGLSKTTEDFVDGPSAPSSTEILGTLENLRAKASFSDKSVLISKRRLTHSGGKGLTPPSGRSHSIKKSDAGSQIILRSTDIQQTSDVLKNPGISLCMALPRCPSDVRSKIQEKPELHSADAQKQALLGTVDISTEDYFGMNLMKEFPELPIARLITEQHLSCELFETRVGSLQRLVAFYVMFHEMGKRVQDFWRVASFGLLGYEMDRTHSVMRVATTASPVSAIEVNERVMELRVQRVVLRARAVFLSMLDKGKNPAASQDR